jgi:hypothetical protein
MTRNEANPAAPLSSPTICASRRPIRAASHGITNAHSVATPLYTANSTPTQFAPSLYAALVVSVVPNTCCVTIGVV